jgi:hypothetical protein
MTTKVDIDFVKPYFNGNKKHRNYYKCVDVYHHLSFHFEGYRMNFMSDTEKGQGQKEQDYSTQDVIIGNPYFSKLIDMRRPSESDAIKAYRRMIYLPFTKMPCAKVYNCLRKIIKSSDWKIDYSKSNKPSKIADNEYLEDYCEKNYPTFDSVENWAYTFAFRSMLIDPNGLCVVLPMKFNIGESDYYKPFSYVVPSKNVYDFKEDHLAVWLSEKKSHFVEQGKEYKGDIVCVLTNHGYWEAHQINLKKEFDLITLYETKETEEDFFPAFQLGGVIKDLSTHTKLYESFVTPILPGLDAAAREVSDNDATVVQHHYPTMWYYQMQNCDNCKGTGRVNQKGKQVTCNICDGHGAPPKSPYRDMVLKPGAFDQDKIPTPPAGYIQKDYNIVKIQDDRIKEHVRYALSAISMEFLQAPLVQSGLAKEVDRDELNNFVYGVAYHLVESFIKPVYYYINEWRYRNIITSPEEREKMLPTVAVPEKFDLLTEGVVEAQLKAAKDNGSDPFIVQQLELEYAAKKFPSDPDVRDMLRLKQNLDPLPGLTFEQKQASALGKTSPPEDVIISINVHSFVKRALVENKDFITIGYEKQMEVLKGYAKEKTDAVSAAQKIKDKADKGNHDENLKPGDEGYDAKKDKKSPKFVDPKNKDK